MAEQLLSAKCYSLFACRNKVNTGTGQRTLDKLGDPVFPFLCGNKLWNWCETETEC